MKGHEIVNALRGALGRKPQEITPRAVEARRKESAAKRGASYIVKQGLVIPDNLYTGEALLAPIVVKATNFGLYWEIRALKGPMTQSDDDDADSTPPPTLGKIIYNGPKISTDEALEIANGWVTDSCISIDHRERQPVPSGKESDLGIVTYFVGR
jgi:hypothetical protein